MMWQLLTPEQAAERLQISPLTIRNWFRAGRLRGVKIGKLWRVEEKTLVEFATRCLRGADKETG